MDQSPSLMVEDYKGAGRYITMDSAYMGDIMAQVGREVWDEYGGDSPMQSIGSRHAGYNKKMKKGRTSRVVKTLSNCHGPEILRAGDGVSRKRRGEDGKRERESMEVSCPAQTKYYCQTFHLIDKGNGAERPYNMGGEESDAIGSPKIVFWLINMTMANAYRIYRALVTTRTPDRQCLKMKDAIKELTFALMQRGDPMRTREASHPKTGIDLSRVLGWSCGKKVRTDSKREVVGEKSYRQETWSDYAILKRMQKKSPWRSHQSVGAKENARGKCCWECFAMPY
ncbi:hypothetical protein ACHAW5_000521 [Stephanodiscus triporus]|uniref:PiggyBac transposable element-derived protein domain-containing protein n=1 Tax=Stephanodiscus triporus TaxID=2934178 RepID=A0ABD3NPG3_9STRA